jgi:hypothetical protein
MLPLGAGTALPRGIFARRASALRALHMATLTRRGRGSASGGGAPEPVFELVPDALLDPGELAFGDEAQSPGGGYVEARA